jgi:PAS domain-containing protein
VDCQYRLLARDGSVRWFHDRGEFVPDETGMRCVWQGILLDITAEKEAEDALRESEARYRMTFDEAGIGMAVCSLDGSIERVNAALCAFLGFAKPELLALRYQDVTHPDDLAPDVRETEQRDCVRGRLGRGRGRCDDLRERPPL